MSIVVACATFTGSLDRLIGDQTLVGMDWDVGGRGGNGFSGVDADQLRSAVREDPAFDRVTGLSFYKGTVNKESVPVAVFDPVKVSPWPPVVAGRAPAAGDEVLVGQVTLEDLGIRVGERIILTLPDDLIGNDPGRRGTVSQSYTVVGSAVAPAIGEPGQLTPKLGVGALLSTEALGSLAALSASTNVLFGLQRGALPETVFGRFPDGLPFALGAETEWYTSASPAEVSQAAGARTVIWTGVAALAVAVVATVVHTLLGSVRQRRREYAVLKTLGFTRRQIRATVLWQSGAILGPALAIAVPVGVAAGRWLWTAFAEGLGIVVAPAVPLLLLAGSVLVTVAVVEAASLLPASIARRTPIALSLRAE
jgi:hypothetical protein